MTKDEYQIRIKRVSTVKDEKIKISFESGGGEAGPDEYSMICHEEPRPDFHKALQALIPTFVGLCELAAKDAKQSKIIGVEFTHAGENNVMGAVVVGLKNLVNSDGGLKMKTPHKTEGPYKGEDAEPTALFEKDVVTKLRKVQSECSKYIEGVRSQVNMDFGSKK